ncbi:Anthranilate 1,2-dioxygenase large subunit [Methyloligella halotolerans]|uniref:Anthranilate 1,2-dioxygenase large subunit n=2 Tax=Methyloligella halotolerans TaxID=1177755 RepID=A0A1E2RUE1_9HYPH|nr:Anthranilate 1,2-dioxygenase large subunit [Methyloligella halotolerans]
MPARNHSQWSATPPLAGDEWVDSRIYSDEEIFEEELQNIFKHVWVPVCHESELPEPYDFRTTSIANEPIIVTRGPDNEIRAFLNVCPHRGMLIERRPSGSFREGQPSGNPKRMTCMFHAWQFDMKGSCVYISREKEGYQDRLKKEQTGLRRLRCEVKFGGFVWVNLDDQPIPLEEWAGGPFECLRKTLEAEPMEVFHYHKAIINTNYKLWHDTNSEFYHDFMHYHNRVTGFTDSYFARKNEAFEHGHVTVGTFEVNYAEYEGFESRAELSFPHLPPNQWYMIDLFPGINFNLRGSALRCDVVTPLGPNQVMIEFRGLGLKRDTEEERNTRINHHNSIWGPFGRNLHEDLVGVQGQGATMGKGEPRRVLHGRQENQTIHDENGMRHYYDEWGKWMNRSPSHPDQPFTQRSSVAAAE